MKNKTIEARKRVGVGSRLVGFLAGCYLTPLHDVRRLGGFKQYGSFKKTSPGGDSLMYSLRERAGSEDKL